MHMAEVKDPVQETEAAAAQSAPAAENTADTGTKKPKKPPMTKKQKRKLIRRCIAGVVVVAIGLGLVKLLGGGGEAEVTVVTDEVHYDSITSVVQGSGLTKANKTESITLTTAGTVQEVLVTEGQKVTAGDPLFVIDSEDARTAVDKARKDVEGYQKQLDKLRKDIEGRDLTPIFAGKLLETVTLNPGDKVTAGQTVAKLADDHTMKLKQYYSYAYQGLIRAGQSAEVSVPALMSSVPGTISAVHMVERITPEGSKLFEVEVSIPNEGALTEKMVASAIITVDGESIYPYESSELQYNRIGELKTTVGGEVLSSNLLDYLNVYPGQVLLSVDGEDSDNELFDLEKSLTDAQKALEKAEENLENCNAVAPIDGTVMGLALTQGQEVEANKAVISIADTNIIRIDATVDERNVGSVSAGMMVDIDQWGTPFMGMIESVSLNSTAENGVASYPMVITVDNMDGTMMVGNYVNYSLVASQNDNCLVLPIQCVKSVPMEDGGTASVVFVQSGSRPDNAIELTVPVDEVPEGFWPVAVETGISDDYNVEIKAGVEEGTVVYTTTRTENSWG